MWMMSFIINNNGVRIGGSCIVGYGKKASKGNHVRKLTIQLAGV